MSQPTTSARKGKQGRPPVGRLRRFAAALRADARGIGYRVTVLVAVGAVVGGLVVGTLLSRLVGAVDAAAHRSGVESVVTAWGANQRTVEPLPSLPGTRPVLIKDEGDLAVVCRLSGWPVDPCADTGLSPRLDYGTPPRLVHTWAESSAHWVAVLAYTDATDQVSQRWVAVDVDRAADRTWYVHSFIEVPLSTEPSERETRAVLASARRCAPRAC